MVHTILHAEISHRRTLGVRLLVHVVAEEFVHLLDACQNFLVFAQLSETLIGNAVEKFNRVLIHFFPNLCVQATEEVEGFLVPAEPKVVRNLIEGLERSGDVAFYGHILPTRLVGVCDFYVHVVYVLLFLTYLLRANSYAL